MVELDKVALGGVAGRSDTSHFALGGAGRSAPMGATPTGVQPPPTERLVHIEQAAQPQARAEE